METSRFLDYIKKMRLIKDRQKIIERGLKFGISDAQRTPFSYQKEDVEPILKGFLMIEGAIENVRRNQIEDAESLFSHAASHFEEIDDYTKTGVSDDVVMEGGKYHSFVDLYFLSAICYDLGNYTANAQVMAKKSQERLQGPPSDEPEEIQIRYPLKKLFLQYFLRDYNSSKDTLEKLEEHRKTFIEYQDEIKDLWYFLACFEVLEAFKQLFQYWESGSLVSYTNAVEILKSAIDSYNESGDLFFHYCCRLILLSFDKEKNRTIHILPKEGSYWKEYIESLKRHMIFNLWPPQLKLVRKDYLDAKSLFLSAPTSAGKSLIAELLIVSSLKESRENKKTIIYIVPSKALASQVWSDLSKGLEDIEVYVDVIVGGGGFPNFLEQVIVETANILIVTPEKLNSLLNRQVLSPERIQLVIFDEIHNMGDQPRGFIMEQLLTRLKSHNRNIRFVLQSAVVQNPSEIQSWLSPEDGKTFESHWRPTTQINGIFSKENVLELYEEGECIKIPIESLGMFKEKRTAMLAIVLYKQFGVVMIYSRTRKSAQYYAKQLYNQLKKEIINENIVIADKIRAEMGEQSMLAKFLEVGIAYHHAGVSSYVKQLIESLLKGNAGHGKLRIIACTSTLIEGVNSTVSTLVIPSLEAGNAPLSMMRIKNLMGRAGRAKQYTRGFVVFVESDYISKERALAIINTRAQEVEEVKSCLEELATKLEKNKQVDRNLFDKSKLYQQLDQDNLKKDLRNERNTLTSLNKEIVSSLVSRSFNGESPENFLGRTYFGYRYKNDKHEKFSQICELISGSLSYLSSSENLSYHQIFHYNPYKPTRFGYCCNRAGLAPKTMDRLAIQLLKMLETNDLKKIISASEYSSDLDSELETLFKLFFDTEEIRDIKKELQDPNYVHVILDWIKGSSLQELRNKYFLGSGYYWQNDDDAFQKLVDFSNTVIVEYGTWIASGINQIFDFFHVSYEKFLSSLPLYLTYGSTSSINCLLQLFKISPRNDVLKEFSTTLERKDASLREGDVAKVLTDKFYSLPYEEFFEEDKNSTFKEILDNYKQFMKTAGKRLKKAVNKIKYKESYIEAVMAEMSRKNKDEVWLLSKIIDIEFIYPEIVNVESLTPQITNRLKDRDWMNKLFESMAFSNLTFNLLDRFLDVNKIETYRDRIVNEEETLSYISELVDEKKIVRFLLESASEDH